MSEYLPSFIVEPVLRQARRFSRQGSTGDSSGYLPTVSESIRTWTPSRFWSASPPPSMTEDENQPEGSLLQIRENISQWTNQIPSPPLEPMELGGQDDVPPASHNVNVTDFPALERQVDQQPRPVRLDGSRTNSEQSLNPLRELPDRARIHERGHAHSDPTTGTRSRGHTISQIQPATSLTNGSDDYRRRDGSGTLPEDDGMGPLRQRIIAVWKGEGTAAEKSRLIHILMTERYRLKQAKSALTSASLTAVASLQGRPASPMSIVSGSSQEVVFNLTASDLQPTYYPIDLEDPPSDDEVAQPTERTPELGCIHYKRNIKLQCHECGKWYTCRLCHDEAEDHILPRKQTKHMLCMFCNSPQVASQMCKMCGQIAASYYCSTCKLWSDDPSKSIYHCDDCGICRLGKGLGKDFFHCKTCAACMSINAQATHKCIEKSTQCDCPICGEYLFTSNKSVAFMSCGHSIHETCFTDWCNSSYKCPICSKSITSMELQFRRLDRHIADQPMPEEYRNTRAYIFCNDCSSRSTTQYHWLGLKCERCESYNTAQLQLLGSSDTSRGEIEAGEALDAEHQSRSQPGSNAHTPVGVAEETQRLSLAEHRLTNRSSGARSVSPMIGSYFGTSPRAPPHQPAADQSEEDLDFWGATSLVNLLGSRTSADEHEEEEDSASSSSSADYDIMDDYGVDDDDDDAEEEDDLVDLPGHR